MTGSDRAAPALPGPAPHAQRSGERRVLPSLTSWGLFTLACRHALADGWVGPGDNLVLGRLQRFLKLAPEGVKQVLEGVQAEFLDGRLPLGDPDIDRARLFLEACEVATRRGAPGRGERAMLRGLALALELSDAQRDRLFHGVVKVRTDTIRAVRLSQSSTQTLPAAPPAAAGTEEVVISRGVPVGSVADETRPDWGAGEGR